MYNEYLLQGSCCPDEKCYGTDAADRCSLVYIRSLSCGCSGDDERLIIPQAGLNTFVLGNTHIRVLNTVKLTGRLRGERFVVIVFEICLLSVALTLMLEQP